ncbi:MAG: ABC transporter permease subunit [Candidatus Hodarchaeales archaeon]|jgi:simple sugar transport system permease protein
MTEIEQIEAKELTPSQVMMSKFVSIGRVIAVPLISILIAFIIGTFVLIGMGKDPVLTFSLMTLGLINIEDPTLLLNILFYTTPLIFTGLSVAVAFRAGMFNIGTEGQLYFGAFLTALVGFGLNDHFNIQLPAIINIPLLIVVGAVGGAVWALIPAILKARGVHEVISTIMMNYIALTLMVFLIGDLSSPFSDKSKVTGNVSPQTPQIPQSARIPTFFESTNLEIFKFTNLHWGFIIGILACIVIFIILWKTKLGYEARAVGHNPAASKYGGISVNKNLIYVMLISGALGGLAGGIEVLGFWDKLLYGFSPGYGFDGIAVAIIGGNHPFGVFFGALLFGWLQVSGQILQVNQIPKDIANTLKGLIVFLVAIPLLAKGIMTFLNETTQGRKIKSGMIGISQRINDQKMMILQASSTMVGMLIIWIIYITIFAPLDILARTAISTLIFIVYFLGYLWFKKKNLENISIIYAFLLMIGIHGIIAYINLNDYLGQDVSLFGLIFLIGGFIFYQEWQARNSKNLNKKGLSEEIPDEDETLKVKNFQQGLKVYAFLSAIFAIFLVALSAFGSVPLPFDINIPLISIFFRINSLGVIIGIIGIVLIVISFLLLRIVKVKTPRDVSKIYYLPQVFKGIVVIFSFLAITTIFSMNPIYVFTLTLSIAAPIGLAALGGMFSEKSGVVNIGLEGMMLTGAFVGVWISYETNSPWAGVIGSIIAGALIGILFAIASIKFRADQVVVGVAVNLLAAALTTLGVVAVWNVQGTSPTVTGLTNIKMPFLKDIPIIGQLLYDLSGGSIGLSPLIYVFIVLIFICWWIIQRTTFGLRVRAVGEHPRAADTLGINVYKMRYICVILSGILASLGGAALTLGWVPVFGKDMTTGRGFIALAALIFGAWQPIGAAAASLLFGFAYAFRFNLLGINWIIAGLHLEKLTPTLPYLVTLIAVSVVAKRMRPPAADGIPYVKEGG